MSLAFLIQVSVPDAAVHSFAQSHLLLGYTISAVVGLLIGAAIFALAHNVATRGVLHSNLARYPRDWPKRKEVIAPGPGAKGYDALTGKRAIGSGAMRMGYLYPRSDLFRLIPATDFWRDLRWKVLGWTTKELWIPEEKRLRHFSCVGPTGSGKSTTYVFPLLAYGAFEERASHFVVDVKTPQIIRVFGDLYRRAGKRTYFLDPWSADETLGIEPLWRSNADARTSMAEVISTYTASGQPVQEAGNSEFFNIQAQKTIRALLDLSLFWPRRMCNLPVIQQLVLSGGTNVQQAFKNGARYVAVPEGTPPDKARTEDGQPRPTEAETIAAAEVIAAADESDLRAKERPENIERALFLLDHSGYAIGRIVKAMRAAHADARNGRKGSDEVDRRLAQLRKALTVEIKERAKEYDRLCFLQGEFNALPPETAGSVIGSVANKMVWFRDTNIARAFSRDEFDPRVAVDQPCLVVLGAPMGKLPVGSLFVASLVTNLIFRAVFERGMALEKKVPNTPDHIVHLILDEFPQLNIRGASQAAATFRGFRAAMALFYQDRGQIERIFGQEYKSLEANLVHKSLLPGTNEETSKYYAESFGEAALVTKSTSKTEGQKQSVSRQVQRVPRMTMADVRDGRLNGEIKPEISFVVGAETPCMPMIGLPFYEDPVVRKLLGMKKTVKRDGPFPWKARIRWDNAIDPNAKFVNRLPRERGAEIDPYEQYLEFLIGREKTQEVVDGRTVVRPLYRALEEPVLEEAVVVGAKKPEAPAGGGFGGFAPFSTPPAFGDPGEFLGSSPFTAAPAPETLALPVADKDLRDIVTEDFADAHAVPEVSVPAGEIPDRLAAAAEFTD